MSDNETEPNAVRSVDAATVGEATERPAPTGREAATALYRAHAAARIRGDAAEARRLSGRIGESQRMTHHLFVLCLFAQAVIDRFGSRPDPDDLAELTKRLHDKHFPGDSAFNALHAEALIRAIDGESILFTEVPYGDQPEYMWAVMGELVDRNSSDTDLAERFAAAEVLRIEWSSRACTGPVLERTARPSDREAEPSAERRGRGAGPATVRSERDPNGEPEFDDLDQASRRRPASPGRLRRDHVKALIAGDIATAARLRLRFGPHELRSAAAYLRASTAVCLEYRFGPGAGLGADQIDRDALAAFMAEIRASPGERPPDHLAVEGVIRSLYGEPHLSEPLRAEQQSAALCTVLRHQVRAHPWLAANPDVVVDRARQVVTAWDLA